MKRYTVVFLMLTLLLALSACGQPDKEPDFIPDKNALPTPEDIVGLTGEQLLERLDGHTRDEVFAAWGEPAIMYSGLYGNVWEFEALDWQASVLYDWESKLVTDARCGQLPWPPEDFALTISWGPGGENSYDSESGQLAKAGDEEHPEGRSTQLELSRKNSVWIYDLLVSYYKNYHFPDDYRPALTQESSDEVLSMTATYNGQTRTVQWYSVPPEDEIPDEGIECSMRHLLKSIVWTLEHTEEWDAL